MNRLHKSLMILVAILAVLVGATPAHADGGVFRGTITSEGVMPWHPVKGEDPNRTYVRLSEDRTLVSTLTAERFAAHFGMTADELRAANQEFTLAVCLDGGKPRRSPPIHGNVDRTSNEIWVDCEHRDVWLIPGSTYVMKKLEDGIPFDIQQTAVRQVASCTTKKCMVDAGQKLAQQFGNGEALAAAPKPLTPPPAPPKPAPERLAANQEFDTLVQERNDLKVQLEKSQGEVAALNDKLNKLSSSPPPVAPAAPLLHKDLGPEFEQAKIERDEAKALLAQSKEAEATSSKQFIAAMVVAFCFFIAFVIAFWSIQQKNGLIQRLRTENSANEETYQAKEAEVVSLKRQLTAKNDALKDAEQSIETMDARIKALKQSSPEDIERAVSEAVEPLTRQITSNEQEIGRLERENGRLERTVAASGELVDFVGTVYELMSTGSAEIFREENKTDIPALKDAVMNAIGSHQEKLRELAMQLHAIVSGASSLQPKPLEVLQRCLDELIPLSDELAPFVPKDEAGSLKGQIQAAVLLLNDRKLAFDLLSDKSGANSLLGRIRDVLDVLEDLELNLRPSSIPKDFDAMAQTQMAPSPVPPAAVVVQPSNKTLVPGQALFRSVDREAAFDGLKRFRDFFHTIERATSRTSISLADRSEIDILCEAAVTFSGMRFQCLDAHGGNTSFSLGDLIQNPRYGVGLQVGLG